jgi:putative exporter of polyketide antibiotics
MADDSKGSGLSTTEVVLLVLGVLVVGWFLLGLVHLIFGLVWTLAKVAVVVVLVVVAVKFLFGRSKTS